MMEWRPIGTAPLRTVVLVYDKYEKICTAWGEQYSDHVGWIPHPPDAESDFIYPTHWMPLPEPPK